MCFEEWSGTEYLIILSVVSAFVSRLRGPDPDHPAGVGAGLQTGPPAADPVHTRGTRTPVLKVSLLGLTLWILMSRQQSNVDILRGQQQLFLSAEKWKTRKFNHVEPSNFVFLSSLKRSYLRFNIDCGLTFTKNPYVALSPSAHSAFFIAWLLLHPKNLIEKDEYFLGNLGITYNYTEIF